MTEAGRKFGLFVLLIFSVYFVVLKCLLSQGGCKKVDRDTAKRMRVFSPKEIVQLFKN